MVLKRFRYTKTTKLLFFKRFFTVWRERRLRKTARKKDSKGFHQRHVARLVGRKRDCSKDITKISKNGKVVPLQHISSNSSNRLERFKMTRFVVSLWVRQSLLIRSIELRRSYPWGSIMVLGTVPVRGELEKNGVTLVTRDVPRVSESVVSSN
jgi:hypothetical protein